ncbi:MAG: carbamoyltransferase [Candidatus Krumholzibacteriota bacterium]|nr:carbamoyltransferase [Candidatus Krumholzibacteriota bacterium]
MSSDTILGISAYYHDSAAAIIDGGNIFAAQEERYTRVKHDRSFPSRAIRSLLKESGISPGDLSYISFYEKPLKKFDRLIKTHLALAPAGSNAFLSSMSVWAREKLFLKNTIKRELATLGISGIPLLFPEHHLSHAASAFYPSPFEEAAILTIDGVGEWTTTAIWHGNNKDLTLIRELRFPHSVGLFYSAVTSYAGFRVNSGEYKLMGLAPFGDPDGERVGRFRKSFLEQVIDIREDGSILLNIEYFDFLTGSGMTDDRKWTDLFGIPRRPPDSPVDQAYIDIALAAQQITEDILFRLARSAKDLTGSDNLALAGGVALNSSANGKLLKKRIFENIWIQPAAGDAGGALGAAFAGWHTQMDKSRIIDGRADSMNGACLGPAFSADEIGIMIKKYRAPFRHFDDFDELARETASLIADDKIIGWFQGRMEFGPRALGNRSILADARNPAMQKRMNAVVKRREAFRPFAPSVLEEDIEKYFDLDRPSPYMLFVVPVIEGRLIQNHGADLSIPLQERIDTVRSDIPAVTHIDGSARIQSVRREDHPRFWTLIDQFKQMTGYGIVLNTSFNVRGEPIVCTPDDAYRCFISAGIDYLVVGDYLFDKRLQGDPPADNTSREERIGAKDLADHR